MLEDACKEMGLSDEAAEQITTAYGKQAEEKINKVNSMVEFVAKQVKIEREKFYQEHGEPAYRVGSSPARNNPSKPVYIQTVWGVGYRFNKNLSSGL